MNYLFNLFLTVALAGHGAALNCTASCGNHGRVIRFPFRIKNKQPDCRGYPGFDVSCTENNHTVLELPTSVKLYIHSIDYESQVMEARYPPGCLLRQRLNFSQSASHFQINAEDHKYDFTLFNCSMDKERSESYFEIMMVPCLSTPRYKVYAIHAYEVINYYDLLSCTKMHDIFSVPHDLISQDNKTLHLSWSNPKCASCERKGQLCRLKDKSSTHHNTECYGMHGETEGARKKGLIAGVILGFFLVALVVSAIYKVYSSNKIEREYQDKVERFLDDYRAGKPTRYTYADLKKITNQFKDELGQGAYGTVFKGKLTSEIPVAVKLLNNSTGNGEEFVNEVGTMAAIHHVNVVRLIGFCADGFRRALVYEYLPNDSLEKFICSANSRNHFLCWERQHHIALGIAKGIEYLHHGCDQRILHFDIKPHNILLDNDFNPKIADFGMAKLCSKDKSAISMTAARGTIGYIAPEVFSRNFGNVSYKSDVYSFGMLVLEMVGGRKNVDDKSENSEEIYFPEWIYNLFEEGQDLRFHMEEEEDDSKIAKKLAMVGLWCIQWNPVDRPSVKVVVQMLEGEGDSLSRPPNPFSSTVSKRIHAGLPRRRLNQELAAITETE